MQQDILINWSPQETRVAVVENGAVQELHVERTLERGLVGNVYLGKVARVLPGMQSAFIDIGLERAAFLHVADVQVNGVVPRSTFGGLRDQAGNSVPLQTFEELLAGIGSDGSRDHSFHDPKYIRTSFTPAFLSAKNVFEARAPLKQ